MSMPQGNWAIVGLGAGTMACYLQPGQTLTYYEIDPHVASIAGDRAISTFCANAPRSQRSCSAMHG